MITFIQLLPELELTFGSYLPAGSMNHDFLWFALNLEPASFLSWPVPLGNICYSW